MATTPKVLLKRSSIAGRVPDSGDLQYGELAINFADGKLYYKDDSNNIRSFIDSARVQAIADRIESVAESQLDSGEVTSLIDSTYINTLIAASTINDLIDRNLFLDSAEAIQLIDSAYVNARVDRNLFLDSAEALDLIDSAHVQSKITTAYISSLNTDADTVDGYHAQAFFDAIDSAVTALVDGAPGALDTLNELAEALNDDSNAYNNLLSLIAAQLDSAEALALIDSSHIQSKITTTFINSLNTDAKTLNGDSASYYLNYNNLTNTPNVLDSTNVSNIILSDVTKTFVDGLEVNADTLDGFEGTYYLNYNNFNNTPYIPKYGTDYVDSAWVHAMVDSFVDSAFIRSHQDFRYASLTGVPTNVSTFANDANYLDST